MEFILNFGHVVSGSHLFFLGIMRDGSISPNSIESVVDSNASPLNSRSVSPVPVQTSSNRTQHSRDKAKKDLAKAKEREKMKRKRQKEKKDKEKRSKESSKKRREKKRKLSSSSGTSSSDSSLSSSSSEQSDDEGTNWSMLASVWPVERRPIALQDKEKFNKMELNNLLTIAKFDTDNKKAVEGDLSSSLTRDRKPRTVKIRSGRDNGFKRLHPARFLRAPLGDIKKWWRNYPRIRSHMFKNLPLRFSGAHNKVTQKTIQCAHDRTKCLNFKMFHSGNLNVTSRPLKKLERREDDGVFTTVDFQWEAPTSLSQVSEALLNYCSVLQQLFPLDPSGLIIMRLVNKYNFASSAPTIADRISLISTFFNLVCRENSARAERKEVIMSYSEQEECLKGVLISAGVTSSVPAGRSYAPTPNAVAKPRFDNSRSSRPPFAVSYNGSNNQNGNPTSLRSKVVLFNGMPICFNYNNNNCRNATTSLGCVDHNKKNYAHQCNKFLANKQDYCFLKHSRVTSHQ